MVLKSMKSPFVTGGPVLPDLPVYISRDSDETAIVALQRNEYATIIGSRQVGKTSLLLKLQSIVEKQGKTSVFLDMSAYNRENVKWEQWSVEVCSEIERQVRASCLFKKKNKLKVKPPETPSKFPYFLSELIEYTECEDLLIFIDEAAAVPVGIRDPFYSVIRSIFNLRNTKLAPVNNCNFIFAGVFVPERLVENRLNSPFNVSQIIEISDFTRSQTEQLLTQLETCFLVKVPPEFIDAVYDWTGGHPYLSQKLAAIIARKLEVNPNVPLNHELVKDVIPVLVSQASDNIEHVIKSVIDYQKGLINWVRLIMGENPPVYSRNISEILQLTLIGAICEGDKNLCQIRNRIYRQEFSKALELIDVAIQETSSRQVIDQTNREVVIVQMSGGTIIENMTSSVTTGNIQDADGIAIGDYANALVARNVGGNEIAKTFSLVTQEVNALPDGPDKTMALTALDGLLKEIQKGDDVQKDVIVKWLDFLAQSAPNILQLVIEVYSKPTGHLNPIVQHAIREAELVNLNKSKPQRET